MKKEDLRFGQMVFINSLQHTKYSVGLNDGMENLIGTFMPIEDFCPRFRKCIRVEQPGGGICSIHIDDISSDSEPNDERRIIKVESKLTAQFDEKTLVT